MTARSAFLAPIDELQSVVGSIVDSREVLAPIKARERLTRLASRGRREEVYAHLAPLAEDFRRDPLAAFLAVYALAKVRLRDVDELFLRLLATGEAAVSEHVAWAFSRRRPYLAALPHLQAMVERGGFARMMAELAIECWLSEIPELIWQLDHNLAYRFTVASQPTRPVNEAVRSGGRLRIAQILMQGRVDADLSAAGTGDGGGLITLQVGLTRELARHERVAEVYLVTRSIDDGSGRFNEPSQAVGEGTLVRLPFGDPGYLDTSELWAHRMDLERQLRQFLTERGPFDAVHLRFADVGTFAAARVAADLEIPIFFTLAPDPHGVIEAAEAAGELTRSNFGEVDGQQHYLFRAWLVEWLVERSERLALLPRVGQRDKFERLLGIDVESTRFAVIPEGVDFARSKTARDVVADLAPGSDRPGVISDLEEAIAAMPPERWGLPLLLTVGRLHPIKGMERVVAAWAAPEIREKFNLVIVGGNLDDPSPGERSTLVEIARSLNGAGQDGLVMLGGRTHHEVSLVMAAAVAGTSSGIGSRSIYVCGSAKEEFGLAIVEAMAAGLPVVVPENGGPATYVDHGFTGYLVDTSVVKSIQEGIRWAEGVRTSDLRADASRNKIGGQYSLSVMADALVELYRPQRAQPTAS